MAEVDRSRSRWMLLGGPFLHTSRWIGRILKWLAVSVGAAILFIFVSNLLLFPTYRHIPSRARAPDSASCADARSPGWDALAAANNNEWAAIDQNSISARKLACSIPDPEQTQTIGNLDPPRSPRGNLRTYGATMKPFGTTHELRASDKASQRVVRKISPKFADKEIPIAYREVMTTEASCPIATGWLSRAKNEKIQEEAIADPGPRRHYATNWDTYDLKASTVANEGFPALRFVHGFADSGISPPTRPNDPFWNLRAFDTALAEHDGYMLSSFICAMNQLVLDDITTILPPASAPARP